MDEPPRPERPAPPRLGTRRAYSGKVISVDVDTVGFPDGSVGEIEMVRHPGASGIVPFLDGIKDADPRILLIRQYRYATDGFLLEIPAGRLEPGEDPRDCALRELKEETGWCAGGCHHVFTLYTTPGFTDELIHIFAATELEPGEPELESDEFLRVETVRLSEAIRMIDAGEIQDAKTALAILVVARRRESSTFGPGKESNE